ncbi:Hypothetical_protein [Hexamita inflata]|uniref:Hypothetical_protein n=1 Tax=Hexamita inflata TaxID=28002 RepID=A0AA86TZL0_9EUKA|nr:Hypothetical protein HINF_LOCUS20612 [Hexamita inflata]
MQPSIRFVKNNCKSLESVCNSEQVVKIVFSKGAKTKGRTSKRLALQMQTLTKFVNCFLNCSNNCWALTYVASSPLLSFSYICEDKDCEQSFKKQYDEPSLTEPIIPHGSGYSNNSQLYRYLQIIKNLYYRSTVNIIKLIQLIF